MSTMYAHKTSDESSEEEQPSFKRRKLSPPASLAMASKARNKTGAQASGSFASRMMAKMGYVEGQGLGAAGRGRLAPIETQLRPQGAGLGAVKEKTKQAKDEEKREAAFQGRVLEDSSDEEKRRRRAKNKTAQNQQAARGQTPVGRKKPKIKTIAEIEKESAGLKVPDVLKTIIDATGSETKLLASATGLMSQGTTYVTSETEEVKIARRAQRDVTVFSDEWMALKERENFFADEGAQLSTMIKEEEDMVTADTKMLAITQGIQNVAIEHSQTSAPSSAWKILVEQLRKLENISLQDTESSNCHEIAVAAIYPLFRTTMSQWSPLEDPAGVSAHLDTLHLVLGIEAVSDDTTVAVHNDVQSKLNQRRTTTHYETMIYTFWLPPVRTAVTQKWDFQDPTPLLNLVEAWRPVLPTFVLANVIDQLVVKRLTDAVAAWNPMKARKKNSQGQPPHVWLFPWLRYLDEQHTDPRNPTGLMSDVKRKFKAILSTWNLSQGLVPGLDNWKSIFQSDLSSMLVRYLLPRFRPHLAEFEVNPREQDETFAIIEDVLQWGPLFSLSAMAELIKSEFFPKWHQSLYIWLTTPSVNYDEVGQWYQWWKSVFEERLSPGFNELPLIAAEWQRGLESMLEAAELGPEAATKLPPPELLTALEKAPVPMQKNGNRHLEAVSAAKPAKLLTEMPTTFKDVLEEWCANEGIHLVPLREADVQTGLPLFRITASASLKGGVVVYLKGDVVWVRGAVASGSQGRTFTPMGLDDALIMKAEGK